MCEFIENDKEKLKGGKAKQLIAEMDGSMIPIVDMASDHQFRKSCNSSDANMFENPFSKSYSTMAAHFGSARSLLTKLSPDVPKIHRLDSSHRNQTGESLGAPFSTVDK